jgi:hypothetical protein
MSDRRVTPRVADGTLPNRAATHLKRTIAPDSLAPVFDVFLCHNSADKDEVRDIATRLKACGIRPWFDEWELRPGVEWQVELERAISAIHCAAVPIGPSGLGPWQNTELQGYLWEFHKNGRVIIPVILRTAPLDIEPAGIPIYLKNRTWVDFRIEEPDPFSRLLWGITGSKC